jgi:response regulator RpfG family c-di-GMP phosphodiesterase
VASTLSQVGVLTIPASVVAKARGGETVTPQEQETLNRLPEISSNLIRHIPRLEEVASAIHFMAKNYDGSGFPPLHTREEEIPLAARILKVADDYLDCLARRSSIRLALDEMALQASRYDPRVLGALAKAVELPDNLQEQDADAPRLATHETVQAGQILVEGVETREGLLVYPPLTRVGQSHLERMTNFARLVGLKEPFLVLG